MISFFKKRPYILFILPGFLLFSVFVVYPILYGMQLSLFSWSGLGPKTFIGFENFRNLLFSQRMSRILMNALSHNLQYMLTVLLIILPLQLIFAYLIYLKVRGHKAFRLLIFLPNIISSSVIGFFIMMVFNPDFGILNGLLDAIGLGAYKTPWLGDPSTMFPCLMIVVGWAGIGYGMSLFIANMQGISHELIEASYLDGAGNVRRFFSIVLPLIWPSLTNIIVLDVIWSITVFDLPFIAVGSQGGANAQLDFVNLLFYRYGFGNAFGGEVQIGFASAVSVIVFLIIMVLTVPLQIMLKRLEVKE